jgi:RecB family exonuclease
MRVSRLLQDVGVTRPYVGRAAATARDRGTAVHADLAESVWPLWVHEGITEVLEDTSWTTVATEHALTSDRLALGGTIDAVLQASDGRGVVLDHKTGAMQAWHRVQLACYEALLCEACPEVSEWVRLLVYHDHGRVLRVPTDDPPRTLVRQMVLVARALDPYR